MDVKTKWMSYMRARILNICSQMNILCGAPVVRYRLTEKSVFLNLK